MKYEYVIEYLNENEFKKLERAIKKYNMIAYKKLMFEYPENAAYRYNYGFCINGKIYNLLHKLDRTAEDTQKAIDLIIQNERYFKGLKKFRLDIETEKILRQRDFMDNCSDMISLCQRNHGGANEYLKKDLEKANNKTKPATYTKIGVIFNT